jgi:small-conductance mechanosensitive channel
MASPVHRVFANFITALHVGWTFIILLGALAMAFGPRYALLEVVILNVTLLAAILWGNVCPLTLLEERLRQKHDPTYTNHGSYLKTYINHIFKTKFTVKQVNATVAVCYTLIYALAAVVLLHGIGWFQVGG